MSIKISPTLVQDNFSKLLLPSFHALRQSGKMKEGAVDAPTMQKYNLSLTVLEKVYKDYGIDIAQPPVVPDDYRCSNAVNFAMQFMNKPAH